MGGSVSTNAIVGNTQLESLTGSESLLKINGNQAIGEEFWNKLLLFDATLAHLNSIQVEETIQLLCSRLGTVIAVMDIEQDFSYE
jgi:hypothetical protein